jgi:hypothetical protein
MTCALGRIWSRNVSLGASDAMPYTPTLPPDAPQLTVDTSDWRYKATHDFAERNGWSQEQFSKALGDEARRVAASAPKPAAPVPTPAPAPKVDYSKMTTAQKFAAALASSPTRRVP